jgi:hypothetical protein
MIFAVLKFMPKNIEDTCDEIVNIEKTPNVAYYDGNLHDTEFIYVYENK